MRSIHVFSAVAVSLVVACADLPAESTTGAEVVVANRMVANRMVANRLVATRLITTQIAGSRLADGRMQANSSSADELLATEDGREVFSVIVSCALAADVTLVASIGGTDFEFFGELGLAPRWLSAPLDAEGQGWVSACMFARINGHEVAIPISLRGAHRGLETGDEEREGFSVEEGAFFGNFFGPIDEPLQWYACRGEGQASGEFGGLVERDCAEPDPANPGFTQCGLIDAGDCGDFAARHACEAFSEGRTFYRRCHSAPIRKKRHGCDADDQVFRQVITSFVSP